MFGVAHKFDPVKFQCRRFFRAQSTQTTQSLLVNVKTLIQYDCVEYNQSAGGLCMHRVGLLADRLTVWQRLLWKLILGSNQGCAERSILPTGRGGKACNSTDFWTKGIQMSLANSGDGKQIEVQKMILVASSPFCGSINIRIQWFWVRQIFIRNTWILFF